MVVGSSVMGGGRKVWRERVWDGMGIESCVGQGNAKKKMNDMMSLFHCEELVWYTGATIRRGLSR